jgi:hypothetical protein
VSAAVSVLMPVFNGEAFVREAIASILGQTWTDFEFLIVDDGSTDATPRIVASFRDPRIRVITSPAREGIARALNRALAAATAPLVARQDADDVSHPTRIEKQIAFLDANPSVALVGTQVRVIGGRGRFLQPPGWRRALTHEGIRFQSLFDNPFIHGSVVFRRDAVGLYDATFTAAEDFDMWSREAARHTVRNLPEALLDFRVHAASMAAHFGSDYIAHASSVIERNLRGVLSLADVPVHWPRLLSSMHVDPRVRGPVDGRELIDVIDFIHRRYPERGNADVARAAAVKYGEIALFLATRERTAALRAYRRAWRCDARTASAFATRFVPLLLLGESVRGWWRRR